MNNEKDNGRKVEDTMPGERSFDTPGLRTHDQFLKHLQEGEIGDAVSALHDQDKEIVAHWRPGRITLLIAGSVGLLGVAVAGGVLLKNRNKDSSNSPNTL